jgi:regulator of sigma E protease
MPEIILVILAVVFVLGVAINIHEFGHFIVAKMFGMRVEAYSFFGLGPRIWGFKRGHTDYRISAIPLGAYVKLYGDEATAPLEGGESDGEKVPDSELYELRPRWQKFLVMVGGPVMNILLALAIPFGAAMIYGVPSMPAPIVGLVSPGSAAEQAGIKVGDRIVSFDGTENPTWGEVSNDVLVSPEKPIPVVVERGGQRLPITLTPAAVDRDGTKIGDIGVRAETGAEPVVVAAVQEDMPAAAAGLLAGDKALAVNGQTIKNSNELINAIRENKENPVNLVVERNGERKEIAITPKQSEDGVYRVGAVFSSGAVTAREAVGLGGAAAYAYNVNMEIIRLTGKVFGQLFSGQRSVKDAGLAGPVGIVGVISNAVSQAGIGGVMFVLGIISLNLGVFNLLPIPLLDGGQIMVLGIEKVMSWFGATLSMAIKEKIQLAGLGIILLLMVFTLFLDISRFF